MAFLSASVILLVYMCSSLEADRSPILLVPGAAGSSVDAKLVDKPSVPAWYCYSSTSDYFRLWVAPSSFLGKWALKCWVDNVRLEWDMTTFRGHNPQGVLTRIPGFGETENVEVLDEYGLVKYMKPLVNFLVGLGYTRGKDVRAAPYDFRYSPDQLPDNYYSRVKDLAETMYKDNGNAPVTLMSHSYGSPVTQYFLTTVTDEWKKKYIKQWVSLAGVFSGTVQELVVMLSGWLEGLPSAIVDRILVRSQQRTNMCNLYMLPSPVTWPSNRIVAKTPDRSYTINDIDQLFSDAGLHDAVKMRHKIVNSDDMMKKAPGVPVVCIYGQKPDSTITAFSYAKGEFPDGDPKLVLGDGDSTVNRESLKHCEVFADLQKERVSVHEINGETHNGVFSNDEVHDIIKVVL